MTALRSRAGTGYPRTRSHATLARGIDLHTGQTGRVHQSMAAQYLTDPFAVGTADGGMVIHVAATAPQGTVRLGA